MVRVSCCEPPYKGPPCLTVTLDTARECADAEDSDVDHDPAKCLPDGCAQIAQEVLKGKMDILCTSEANVAVTCAGSERTRADMVLAWVGRRAKVWSDMLSRQNEVAFER